MRRFELVEGTSAKFWSPEVEGSTFIVTFGRLGTAGQRKEKPFPTADAAKKEYDKKVAEKLREGYHEVAADAATQAAPGAKGAAAAAAPLQLPARLHAHHPTPEAKAQAVAALQGLQASLGSRSWVVARQAKKARRALRAVSGGGAVHPPVQAALDVLVAKVGSTSAAERLPLRHALGLLGQREAGAFAKAVRETWKGLPAAHPATESVAVLTQQLEALGDEELALRVGLALVGSSERRGAAGKKWAELAPHLEAFLVRQRSSLKGHLGSVAAAHPRLAERTRARLGT